MAEEEDEDQIYDENRHLQFTRAVGVARSLQQTILGTYRRGHPQRPIVARHKTALAGLRFAQTTATFLVPVFERFAMQCHNVHLAGVSWQPFKDLSFEGYDLVRNVPVDYGNFQYRAVLLMWCMLEPRIEWAMVVAARVFGALDVRCVDSNGNLDRQGDVVEIMLALGRDAPENFGLRRCTGSILEWRRVFEDMLFLCRSVDYLYSHARGKELKFKPNGPCPVWQIDNAAWPHDVVNSSYSLAVLALSLDV